MTSLTVRPSLRMHMKVWRAHPTSTAIPRVWCVAPAVNGLPTAAALRFSSWSEAVAYAIQEAH